MKKLLVILVIGVVGALLFEFVSFAHHTFVTGLNPFLGTVFLFLFVLISVPLLIKGFGWVQRRWVEDARYMPAILFAGGGLSWGIDTLLFGGPVNPTFDIQLHDTMFVIAHLHVELLLMIFLGLIAGVYLLIAKAFTSQWLRVFAYVHFIVTYTGCYITFRPTTLLIAGMPRRYIDYSDTSSYVHLFTNTRVLLIVAIMQVIFVGMILYFLGKRFFAR
jgi:cytochrome c oxidase subunit 1